MLSFFPLDVLDEIWDLTESVSEGFPTFFNIFNQIIKNCIKWCKSKGMMISIFWK